MDVQYNLSGKSALVTGGGTGIGKGCALELLKAGAHVTVAGPDEGILKQAVEEMKSEGVSIDYIYCDVTREEQVKAAVDFAAKGKRLDVALANAGSGFPPGPILALTADHWKPSYEANVVGTAMTIKYAAEIMRAQGGGSIIAISSTTSQRAARFMAPYCVTKAGRVNAIRPGYTVTEATDLAFTEEFKQNYIRKTPLGREGQPLDIAKSVLFLASSQSEWVTGQVLCVCGGFSIDQGEDFEHVARMVHGDDVIDSCTKTSPKDR